MSLTTPSISIVSVVVSGLSVNIVETGHSGKIATFSWDKTDISGINIIVSPDYWRVRINDIKTYLVKDNPIFSMSVPYSIFGNCKTCVEVQAIYPNEITTSYCNELCINNIPGRHCRSQVSQHPPNKKAKISSFKGSQNMRYARAIRMGGKNAFR
jgi:hypothetical protein|tara:strand:- start:4567 stop:5031 length:465 start_codon:yes stop_codon:yes gene_type:complete